jgi:hypothetical protein
MGIRTRRRHSIFQRLRSSPSSPPNPTQQSPPHILHHRQPAINQYRFHHRSLRNPQRFYHRAVHFVHAAYPVRVDLQIAGKTHSLWTVQVRTFRIPLNIFSLLYGIYTLIWLPFPSFSASDGDKYDYGGPVIGAVIRFTLFAGLSGKEEISGSVEIEHVKY